MPDDAQNMVLHSVGHAPRKLLVQGFSLNWCKVDMSLLSPQGFSHMVEDPKWLSHSGTIVYLLIGFFWLMLMIIAARLDAKRHPVLQKIKRAREIASKEYYAGEATGVEGLPAYEDFVQQFGRNTLDLQGVDVEEVTDKSWEWLMRMCARSVLQYVFKWKMGSLEPGAFQYIKQEDFRAEAATAATDFVLSPQYQHVMIFLLTSSRLSSSFLASYKHSRFERVVSLSVELLSTLAMMVVLFHWLGYLGEDERPECEHSESTGIRILEQAIAALILYFANVVLHYVALRIQGNKFLLSKAQVEKRSMQCLPILRRCLFWILECTGALISLYVVLHFMAIGSDEDMAECLLAMSALGIFAMVIIPMFICASLMLIWTASSKFKAGMLTEQMLLLINIAEHKSTALSSEEIQRLDHAFAQKLLAPHPDAGPIFFEHHHESPPEVEESEKDPTELVELKPQGPHVDGQDSMVDRLMQADLEEAVRTEWTRRSAPSQAPSYPQALGSASYYQGKNEAPGLHEENGLQEDMAEEVSECHSESWEELNSEEGSASAALRDRT